MRDERFIVKDYYIRPDSFFFEPLEQWYVPDTHFMRIVEDCLSKHGQRDAWNLHRNGAWFHTGPKGITLPSQGWKIHVSAQLDRAEYILSTVADILILESVSFKWALDKTVYTIMLDKRWPRGGSGKFITIYPNTTDQFHKLIRVLYTLLRDEEGPYILSDRRYKDCRVLHYRYGGFLPMSIVTITGERRPIIRSPADDPVFDRRAPYFILPDWVSDHLAENERELTAHSSTDGRIELNKRYYVERAMHFSNAGGGGVFG